MPKRLTDNQLAQLYLGIARDYANLSDSHMNANEIYQVLYNLLHYSLNSPDSTLMGLDESEQIKARKVLDTFFSACPHYQQLLPAQRQYFYTQSSIVIINQPDNYQECHHYCHTSDKLFTWMMLGALMNSASNNHNQPGSSVSENKAMAYFFAVILCAIIAAAALIAFYYMISEFLNSIERFVYNEGWLKAGMSLAGILAGSAAGASIGIYLAAIPLIALGIGLGLSNPVGLAIGGAVCLALIGAAVTCGFMNWVKPDDKNALDPKDAHRFAITDTEADHMMHNGIDPVKVKCAIVALRQQLGQDEVPSLLNRIFTRSGSAKQILLQQVRQLRRGELHEVTVGNMQFKLDSPEYAHNLREDEPNPRSVFA